MELLQDGFEAETCWVTVLDVVSGCFIYYFIWELSST